MCECAVVVPARGDCWLARFSVMMDGAVLEDFVGRSCDGVFRLRRVKARYHRIGRGFACCWDLKVDGVYGTRHEPRAL
jgi:hypothetical protein